MPEIEALILAAGLGRRFATAGGGWKLGALLDGKPLVRHVVEAALAADVARVRVVVGHEEPKVRDMLAGLDVRFVANPKYADGLSTSLKAGLAAASAQADALVVLLGDMPRVATPVIDALVARYAARPDVPAVVPVVDGVWGNPVLIGRPLFPQLAALDGDRGARAVLEGAAVDLLPMASDAVLLDIDTPAALAAVPPRNAP